MIGTKQDRQTITVSSDVAWELWRLLDVSPAFGIVANPLFESRCPFNYGWAFIPEEHPTTVAVILGTFGEDVYGNSDILVRSEDGGLYVYPPRFRRGVDRQEFYSQAFRWLFLSHTVRIGKLI